MNEDPIETEMSVPEDKKALFKLPSVVKLENLIEDSEALLDQPLASQNHISDNPEQTRSHSFDFSLI